MKYFLTILSILFATIHFAKAQTIQPLAPQTNCSNNFFVDYIATAKLNETKTQLTITGQLITSSDSIADIDFFVEKCFLVKDENLQHVKEYCTVNIYSASLNNSSKNVYFTTSKQATVLKIIPTALTQNNQLAITFNLPFITKEAGELVLVCDVVFKNGCRYLKKQKISF